MRRAGHLIVSHKAPRALILWLQSLGLDVVLSKPNTQVDVTVSDHPDLFVFAAGEKLIVDPLHVEYYGKLLPQADIAVGSISAEGVYPGDTRYNAEIVDGHLVHGPLIDPVLEALPLDRIRVRQGYVRCNVLRIDETSVITSDRGIAKALESICEVLLIEPGHIALEGMPYGFIGGCGGKISETELVLTGNLEKHPDFKRMQNFAHSRGVEMLYMKEMKLRDLGSLIPVFETEE